MDNTKDILLIETIVKLAALNKLLIKKNIITDQELLDEMTSLSKHLVDEIKILVPDNLQPKTINS